MTERTLLPELKPCPFCGAKPPRVQVSVSRFCTGDPPSIRVTCSDCGSCCGVGRYQMRSGATFLSDKDMLDQMTQSAMENWNRRTIESPQELYDREVARMAAALRVAWFSPKARQREDPTTIAAAATLYKPQPPGQDCSGCEHYRLLTAFCCHLGETVNPTSWCGSWKARQVAASSPEQPPDLSRPVVTARCLTHIFDALSELHALFDHKNSDVGDGLSSGGHS